jgi:hypothetical protein
MKEEIERREKDFLKKIALLETETETLKKTRDAN